ncbi:MAG: nucleotidyltransferase domain-containing protein [Pseudomonadota bacterium]
MKETPSSVSTLLFPLQYRGKALALLLLRPERSLHVREIARLTGTVAGTMSKELARLNQAGLLLQHRVGNQVRFSANVQHPVYPELSALLRKTLGLADVLTGALAQAADRIAVAFVFGSVARAGETAHSDIDIMLIGQVGFAEVIELLYEAQTTLQREINPKIFSVEEWRAKIQTNSAFVLDVLGKPKIYLIGNQNDLDELVESGKNRPA